MTDHSLALAEDPDARLYAGLGVSDPSLGRIIHLALSRMLGKARGERAFTRNVAYSVAAVGRLPFRRVDGAVDPAVAPELPAFGWSLGSDVMLRVGLTASDLDRLWASAEAADGVHAVLPLEIVEAFFPAELWAVFAHVVEWGPADAAQRLERVVRQEAQRATTRSTAARPAGSTMSRGTVTQVIAGSRRFLNALQQLAHAGLPSEHLVGWLAPLPRALTADEVGADEATTDRSAPSLILVRRYLRRIDAEIRHFQLTAAGRKRVSKRLRNRLLVGLLAGLGLRIGAASRLLAEDYDPTHRFPGGQIGPALRVYPGKNLSRSKGRWKALAPELAAWLEEYLAHFGITSGPIFPRVRARDGRSMTPSALAAPLRGDRSGNREPRPLIPREDDPTRGYSPHSLRHLAEQLSYSAGVDYLVDHADAARRITPQVFADALLDHVMTADRLGYKDIASEEGRERWTFPAALGLWEYVWGDRGARKAPDSEAITAAQDRLDELAAERSAVEDRIVELRDRRRQAEADGQVPGAQLEDLVRLMLAIASLSGAIEDEHTELERIQARTAVAQLQLADARTRVVAVPDELEDDDFDCGVEETTVAGEVEELQPVRDWLTPAEAAHAFAVSLPTIRRWFRGELPHPEGDPRNPWQPSEKGEVIERHSTRKQRLVVSRLDRSRIAPEVMRSIKEMLLRLPT
jgi:integrase